MSCSSRAFFVHILKLSLRVNLLRSTRQALSILLMLSLAFPPSVLGGTFTPVNPLSLTSLWAQIKGAATKDDPLLDPLERPVPDDAPIIKSKNKDEQKSKVSKLDSSLPSKIQCSSDC